MTVQARHHFIISPAFKLLTRFLIKKHFDKVYVEGSYEDTGHPILLIANHSSWWDGFWIMYLNLTDMHRKVYFMMLEKELQKYWFFKYTGGYPIKKKTRNTLETINYTLNLLKERKNMVFMFPQGKLNSMHDRNMVFEQGAQKIIEKSSPDLQIHCVVFLTDYFSKPKPSLYIYRKSYTAAYVKQHSLQETYASLYDCALKKQITKNL